MRDFIVNVFEGIVWLVFVLIVCGYTFVGYRAATMGRIDFEPPVGAGIGFIIGIVAAVVVTGILFTLIDMRASLDRLVQQGEDRRG